MADNLSVRDGAGDTQTLAAKDVAGVKVPRHNIVDESNNVVAVATSAKQDSQIAALGATDDAEATADGSIVAVLKRLRTLLGNAATSAKQDVLAGLIGEVQASPTSNTLLDRVKSLLTGIQLAASSAIIGKVGHDMTGGGQGYKTVTTGGTPVQLASTTAAKLAIIQAYRANTGYIGVGFSNAVRASGTVGTGVGISLAAGEVLTLPIDDLADVWIDSTVNGEGVRYTYET